MVQSNAYIFKKGKNVSNNYNKEVKVAILAFDHFFMRAAV